MVRCFLTGVQFPLDAAFVLNRREARNLLAALNDRIASLRRVIEQFAPLDDDAGGSGGIQHLPAGFARRKHRLVCKAVAEALAPGYPEICLFVEWTEYQAQVRSAALHSLRGDRRFGDSIKRLDSNALQEADKLSRAVLRKLDPQRKLSRSERQAIAVAICMRHRGGTAEKVTQLIRDAATGVGDPELAGISADDLAAVRRLTTANTAPVVIAGSPDQPVRSVALNDQSNHQP